MNNSVEKVFEELKEKNIINKSKKLVKSKNVHNFKASLIFNKIYYNPSYADTSEDSLRFIFSHEEGHHRKIQRTWLPIILLFCIIPFIFFIWRIYPNVYFIFFCFILYLVLFFFLWYLLKPWLKKDEFDADLWAAIQLKREYKIKNIEEFIGKALDEFSKIRPKVNSLIRIMIKLKITKFLGYHPSNKERIDYIKRKSLR